MHDRLLQALLDIANVRLVASYSDSGLGFDENAIQVFLPDMHLLSDERRKLYQYGTNYADTLLVDVVAALSKLRADARTEGKHLSLIHIGDYLDLWRQSLLPSLNPAVPDQIKDSHKKLTTLLEDHALNTGFLLGNHDFDLYQFTGYNAWERRFFLPGDDPRILVMHGDYFDWIERNLSEDLRDIALFYFGESHEAGDALIGKMRDLTYRCNHPDYGQFIQLQQPAVLGSLLPHDEDLTGNYNLQEPGTAPSAGVQFLAQACEECVNINHDTGSKLRMVIIGHTHHARIATMKMPDGTPFALVDIGAWIETCTEEEGASPVPNAQITALSENQVRIYQLSPK
jgi:UDP-2,3-diacylglucosamine pyrophosphatase LpxH